MTGAHWLLLAAFAGFAGFAVLVVLLRWRWPRVWTVEVRRWVDEPGDPTHEQIDQALDIASEDDERGQA